VVASGAAREVITAEHVARVYGPGVGVIRDPASGRVVVVPVV
jgi:ABC-type cobalamin/Fe3+-siderophores transport system ATPase subunit